LLVVALILQGFGQNVRPLGDNSFMDINKWKINQRASSAVPCKAVGISELLGLFPSDNSAEEWLSEVRWPDEVHCCTCGSDRVSVSAHRQMWCWSRQCRGFFSVKKGAVMQDSKIGVRKWIVLIYLMATNLPSVSTMKLARVLGITQKSAWHITHRVRKALEQDNPERLSGIVELDDTYVGGKERNQHERHEQCQGREVVGKAALVGASSMNSLSGKPQAKSIQQ